jgi:hypothetical protein
VKEKWRRMGIAKAILPQFPVYVTHLTAFGKSLLSKFESCTFNPFQM